DDAGLAGMDLEDVVVEPLPAAVVLDLVAGVRVTGELRPARTAVGRLEDFRRVVSGGVLPVESGVKGRGLARRVRDRDREPGLIRREVAGGKAGHDRRPGDAGVDALVHRVAPERGVEGARVLGIHLDVGGAVALR